ncbi:MAG: hypothetical protein PHF61_05645, partial [Bacteroidales bacterium]|nr:hypothetical protein [Bacteroidales bacterium]
LTKFQIFQRTFLDFNGTAMIYPLKINEFLAVGVPVVMTAFADLPDFGGLVTTAATKEDFVSGLLAESSSDSKARISQRIMLAGTNSWEERAEAFAEILSGFVN